MKIIKINSCSKCPYSGGFRWCGKLATYFKITEETPRGFLKENYHPDCPLEEYKGETR